MANKQHIWFNEPASKWVEALPIGNGRLGAMIHGKVHNEIWQLNEDSVWYGSPRDRNPPDALRNLPRIRQLLEAGKLQEAESLAAKAFMGIPESQRHYEPLGEVQFRFWGRQAQGKGQEEEGDGGVCDYKRYLDIGQALCGVEYGVDGVGFRREVFASAPQNVIVSRFSASQDGKLSFDLRLFRGEDTNVFVDEIKIVEGMIVMTAQTGGGGVRLCLVASVHVEGGNVDTIGEYIVVRNADSAEIRLAACTTFRYPDPEATCLDWMKGLAGLSYQDLRAMHIQDYQSLFSRVELSLGRAEGQSDESLASRSTKERMALARKGQVDLDLIALYYQFGRYLLISSSRPGHKALPANLQGIWNDSMSPPWGSKFTINVNTQMNYWLAEVTNLSECHEPYFDHVKRLAVNGSVTAQTMYGCQGWVAHHNTDLWADSAPQDRWIPATLWPLGGAWLCTHIWDRFMFTQNRDFLRDMIGPLRGSVQFFLDYLIEDGGAGYMVTSPSLSPENQYRHPNGEEGCMCIAPTMDTQILRSLFEGYLAAIEIVGTETDTPIATHVKQYLSKLPPLQIGKHGQLQEWLEDYDEVDPGHRHVSHLWGLYPGTQITADHTALLEACKQTLRRRAAHGGGHTGWSRAWMIALWARLRDGDEAGRQVAEILRTSTHDNLLDDHPPFQIDGNFGATAGITEMLVQSHAGCIVLLPGLPGGWADGVVRGIVARGGFEVGISWGGGSLLNAVITARRGGKCTIALNEGYQITGGGACVVGCGAAVAFETEVDAVYHIREIKQKDVGEIDTQ